MFHVFASEVSEHEPEPRTQFGAGILRKLLSIKDLIRRVRWGACCRPHHNF